MDRKHFWLIPVVLFVLVLALKPREAGHDFGMVAGDYTGGMLSPTPMLEESTAAVPHSPLEPASPTAVPTPAPSMTSVPVPTLPPTVIPTEEPPVLVPEIAPPTPVPVLSEAALPSQPVRLVIPAIGLDSQPVAVGLDEKGVPIVPKHDVAWYNLSSVPGQNSNVVFWGHVLRWKDAPEITAPFARVHELQPGAAIIVFTADGQERHYQVTQQIQARPEEVEYIDPTPGERVTLVSCIGDKVMVDGELTKEFRLVTVAEPTG